MGLICTFRRRCTAAAGREGGWRGGVAQSWLGLLRHRYVPTHNSTQRRGEMARLNVSFIIRTRDGDDGDKGPCESYWDGSRGVKSQNKAKHCYSVCIHLSNFLCCVVSVLETEQHVC